MKVEHLTDLHFNRSLCEWFQKHSCGDIICISGDLIDDSHHCVFSPKQQIVWYRDWLQHFTQPVFICSGNHDVEEDESTTFDESWSDLDFMADDEFDDFPLDLPSPRKNWIRELAGNGIFVDGSITDYMGLKIGCVGYEDRELARFYQCDILLHHLPPSQTPTSVRNGEDWGCKNLRSAIELGEIHPKLVLCGHVHRPQKNDCTIRNTRILNPGRMSIDMKLNGLSMPHILIEPT